MWPDKRYGSIFAINNDSKYDIIKSEAGNYDPNYFKDKINFNFHQTILVRMEINFDYTYASLGGTYVYAYQYVLLDLDYHILFIAIRPSSHVVS